MMSRWIGRWSVFFFICKGKFERVAENESERFEKRGTA